MDHNFTAKEEWLRSRLAGFCNLIEFMRIYDRTNFPGEEKLFIKNVLDEIDAIQIKNHKHNVSLVQEYNNLHKEEKEIPVRGAFSSIIKNESFFKRIGIVETIAAKYAKQAVLCAQDIEWMKCGVKHLNEKVLLISMTGMRHGHRADMVSYISLKDVTTEVNQLLINDEGEREIHTRVISELFNGNMTAKEMVSSFGESKAPKSRHSYLDIPASGTQVTIKEQYEEEIKKEIFYEKDFGTPGAKGYELIYDEDHMVPEKALKYIMIGEFNRITSAPAFIEGTSAGRELLKSRKKIKRERVDVKEQVKKPIYKKKTSAGALEIDRLLANARNNIKK